MHYRHGAEYIFMSTGMSTLLVDEYEYIAKTWVQVRVHFREHMYEYTLKNIT